MKKMMVAAVIVALGWPPFTAKGEPGAAAGAKEPYAPGIAEIMIMTQIRHAKLWLAGNAGNWGPITIDEELNRVYLATEDGTCDYF